MVDFDLQPNLEGDLVRIGPLVEEDFEELFQVASDPLIWEQHQNKTRYAEEEFRQFFDGAIRSKAAFAIKDRRNGQLIGSSRFKVVDEGDAVVEIGWSFLARSFWGGRYNREIKRLMVNYALTYFRRVVFYVHPKNIRSQRAMEKLGAEAMEYPNKPWVLPKDKGITYSIHSELDV